MKFTFRTDKLEGEVVDSKKVACGYISSTLPDIVGILSVRCSSWVRVVHTVAWLLCLVPLKQRPRGPLTCDEVNKPTKLVVIEVQKDIVGDLIEGERGKGRFRKLAPAKGIDGIWRV